MEQVYTIELTETELTNALAGLLELPMKYSLGVYEKIKAQLQSGNEDTAITSNEGRE